MIATDRTAAQMTAKVDLGDAWNWIAEIVNDTDIEFITASGTVDGIDPNPGPQTGKMPLLLTGFQARTIYTDAKKLYNSVLTPLKRSGVNGGVFEEYLNASSAAKDKDYDFDNENWIAEFSLFH